MTKRLMGAVLPVGVLLVSGLIVTAKDDPHPDSTGKRGTKAGPKKKSTKKTSKLVVEPPTRDRRT